MPGAGVRVEGAGPTVSGSRARSTAHGTPTPRGWPAAGLLAVLLLAGCGSGPAPAATGPTGTPPPSAVAPGPTASAAAGPTASAAAGPTASAAPAPRSFTLVATGDVLVHQGS